MFNSLSLRTMLSLSEKNEFCKDHFDSYIHETICMIEKFRLVILKLLLMYT